MGHSLAKLGDALRSGFVKRFDPRFWTVDFPRPMMAAVTTTGAQSLRVDTVFYKANDLAGLIWDAEDRFDHPLLAYETSRDFRGCVLKFRWQSSGIMPLDAVNGPTLTIEGRDAAGAARSWYVRLWNYAKGTPADATITLDFDALQGGFLLPSEGDPVWAGDVDRMFLSLVPPGFSNADVPLANAVEGGVTLSAMACEGPGSVLAIGDVIVPPHGFAIATGYDDAYNQTPARLIRNMFQLGYRGSLDHYVGMSHYFRLEALYGGYYISLAGGTLNAPCAAWHADFAARSKAHDYRLIVSLSYELFDVHCYNDWKQRAWNDDPAHTGYSPPSVLLSPAHAGAMGYLQAVARAFVAIAVSAGHAPRFQVGEPWWWVLPDGRPCLYDDAARAALGGAPVEIPTVRSTALTAAQKALLDAAGAILAASTAALVAAVRSDQPGCETMLLVYLPTVLDAAAPEIRRANVPPGWASPAFDTLQLEDYEWVTGANRAASAAGAAVMTARLGYPVARQHYLSGFVQSASDKAQWSLIEAAARAAARRGITEIFIWALPQVVRDGFTLFSLEEDDMQAFDDISFPLALGRAASVTPGFSTAIVTTASGHEQRNMDWASGRLRFDAGPGVRSATDLQALIGFFRARRGAARGFRFRDPLDHSSRAMTGAPNALDQLLGTGDGVQTAFALVKRYGEGAEAEERRITRPEPASIVVAVNGLSVTNWTLGEGGMINLATAPPVGETITAGFRFDVPVRFAEDSLSIEAGQWQAGDVPSVPIIEIREG
jgi:uncharacterized protein (TIGR02217 family)